VAVGRALGRRALRVRGYPSHYLRRESGASVSNKVGGVCLSPVRIRAGVGYAASCKIMNVTARYMTCMHLIMSLRTASNRVRAGVCTILDMNFRLV